MCSANTALGYAFKSSGMGLNPAVIASKAAEFKRGAATRPPDFYGEAISHPTPQAAQAAFKQKFSPYALGRELIIPTANVRSR